MNIHRITRTILVVLLALLPWIAAPSAGAAGKAPKASAPPTQSEGRSTVASGAAEDSQQACLARIPKDASAGQRMIAEHSCKRDQESRQPMQDAPGH
ncbi:MAG TPA: hypothetical protein VES96_08850 [Nitrospiraceae bacterium]|nr:hypothetical protein [Nitrospiraceae bacterium]